jgi:capsular exopolysaccharide synthesis family protein
MTVSVLGEERQGTARYLQALAQHWPFILGSVALAVAAAVFYLASAEDRYQAHADLLVTPASPTDETFVGIAVIRDGGEGRAVLTVARLVKTPSVAEAVRRRLQLPTTADDLLDSITVAPQEQSNIVTITAEAASPTRASELANAFAAAMIAERTRVFRADLRQVVRRLSSRLEALPVALRSVGEGAALSDRLGGLRGLVGARDPTLQIASAAVPPSTPSWPRPALSLAAAILVGLVLGIGIAIVLELVNPLVLRDEDILEERLALLGRVTRTSTRELQADVASGRGLADHLKDDYRLIRVNLSAARGNGNGPATILVTSAARGEGKTTVAVNLALVHTQTGSRVVLVDADLRRARLSRIFGAPAEQSGLPEVLLDEATADESLVAAPGYGDLRVLTARPGKSQAIDILQSKGIEQMLDELKSQGDVVVFDSPPVTEVADALSLATMVDAVVMVVRLGRTRRDVLADALLMLTQLGVSPVGAVAVTRRRARRIQTEQPEVGRQVPARRPGVERQQSQARG